ncbi:MAG: MAPEG family protein [Gammaproteobacteria bacterium]
MNIAYLSCALLALLLFSLSLTVSMTRLRQQRGYGNEPDPTNWLTKIVRAQANASEYVPTLIALIIILELMGSPGWTSWVMLLAVASRYLHAAGMLLSPDLSNPHPLRFIGSAGTYTCGFLLTIQVIYGAL